MNRSSALKKSAFTLWFLFLSVLAGFAAYYRMFTGFSSYDDEGMLMVTVKQYLGGMKLYNDIPVPYGPVYYFYNWAVRTFSGTPVTHDVVRMSSLIPWLLTALISAWIVFRFTDSLAIASATHLLTYAILSTFFHNESGHPQELCMLLLVCLAASGVVAAIPHRRLLGMILLGTLTAALLLVKVNIGTLAFLATSLALLSHAPKTRLSRLAFSAVATACVILPAVLMRSHLDDRLERMYCVLVAGSMLAALLVLSRVPRTRYFSFRDIWIAFGSFAATFVGVISVMIVQGVNLSAMLHALLLDALSVYVKQRSWYAALPVDPKWLPWILGGLIAAAYFSWNTAETNLKERKLSYLKLGLAILTVLVLVFGAPLFVLVPPFCWLVLYGHRENGSESHDFPRTLLCVVAILQTLYAYPIAGSQMSFIMVVPIIVVMICLGDFLQRKQKEPTVIPPPLVRAAALVFLLCVAAFYLTIAFSERASYDSLPSLQLPGADRIHLQQWQVRDYHWLVQNLNDHCDVFVGLPETPSLHIWTGKDPLARMQTDNWIFSASDEQQIAAAATLSEHPNSCAIYNPALVHFWNRNSANLNSLPLVHYLHENFKVVGVTNQFYLLVRNERNLDIDSPDFKTPFNPARINALWRSKGCLVVDCAQ